MRIRIDFEWERDFITDVKMIKVLYPKKSWFKCFLAAIYIRIPDKKYKKKSDKNVKVYI